MPQRTIDGFEFAETGGVLSGGWPIADLPRLQDILRGNAGAIDFVVRGTHDPLGRAALEVAVSGALQVSCQRCLETMPLQVDSRTTLVLARSEAELEGGVIDADEPERIVAGREMPVRDLIEEEVLLGLPLALRHDHCAKRAGRNGGAKESPFAGLRGMLKQTD